MKEDQTFPKKIVYFSLATPFIAYAAVFFSDRVFSGSETIHTFGYYVSFAILAIGLILGIYYLFFSRQTKGVLPLALFGLILNVLAATVVCQSFLAFTNSYIYYEIQSIAINEKNELKQTILGRMHRSDQIYYFVDAIKAGLMQSCPTCEITGTKIYEKLPEKYKGIFGNSHIGLTYIAIDTDKKDVGNIRFIFPELDPQPTCHDLAGYIEIQRRKFERIGSVTCVEAN